MLNRIYRALTPPAATPDVPEQETPPPEQRSIAEQQADISDELKKCQYDLQLVEQQIKLQEKKRELAALQDPNYEKCTAWVFMQSYGRVDTSDIHAYLGAMIQQYCRMHQIDDLTAEQFLKKTPIAVLTKLSQVVTLSTPEHVKAMNLYQERMNGIITYKDWFGFERKIKLNKPENIVGPSVPTMYTSPFPNWMKITALAAGGLVAAAVIIKVLQPPTNTTIIHQAIQPPQPPTTIGTDPSDWLSMIPSLFQDCISTLGNLCATLYHTVQNNILTPSMTMAKENIIKITTVECSQVIKNCEPPLPLSLRLKNYLLVNIRLLDSYKPDMLVLTSNMAVLLKASKHILLNLAHISIILVRAIMTPLLKMLNFVMHLTDCALRWIIQNSTHT
uniref:Uncharacterized protein n=1 Tax=Dipteran tombus-related virus TaxID=2822553 RepID=A0A8A6RHZ1_9TOMB|nr:hypothetical protein [Dipteran tombus-related virus]